MIRPIRQVLNRTLVNNTIIEFNLLGAGSVECGEEILAEKVNEVIEPVEGAKNGNLFRLITVQEELRQDRDNL